MLLDPLGNAMSAINNAEKARSINYIYIHPASKIISNVLQVMMREGYIGVVEVIDDGKSGTFKVELLGKINKCGIIKPRFPVKKDDVEVMETKYLPSKNFGFLILSTNQGLKTNDEVKELGIGGRLIAYVY